MKGVPWNATLQVVSVPQGGEPKAVTFIVPFYENPEFLKQQLGWWGTYPAELRHHLTVIMVDDGSPVPAADVLRTAERPMATRLFRIHTDVRWNWLAARNIGFHHAADGWCAVTDIDHVIPESTATALVYGKHDPDVIYGFSRIEHSGESLISHPNSWLMTRGMFWRVGGYDERLSGMYGSDGSWRRRCAATAPMEILTDRLIRHEHQGDSSTIRYLRKQPEDARLKALIANFPKDSKPTHLTFQYHEVAL